MGDNYTLGIDLGTTRSAMAYVTDEEPEIIENSEGKDVTPSIVHLTEQGEALVGDGAVDQMLMHPDRTKREVKKSMGDNETIHLGSETYNPQEVSALILQKLIDDAEDRLGGTVSNAVITVPAYFTDRQRNATREAGEIAGLKVDKLLPEPSAAVLAYGLREQQLGEQTNETIFVYDLGGGTFDATLVNAEYEHNYIETIATDGDTELGGSDWTEAIAEFAYDVIEEDTGIDVQNDDDYVDQRERVWEAAIEAKHRLSEQQRVNVTVPFVIPDQSYNLDEELTREEFESMTADLIERTKGPMDDIFDRTDYAVADVDKVLLIGGSTRMQKVENTVEEYFGLEPSKEISPDKAVALGAAVQASVIDDDTETALPSGEEGSGGLALVEALPQSIGVKVNPGNRFDPIVEQDVSIPTTERKEGYSVEHADQTHVSIEVYQGDAEQVADNEYLGEAVLRDIPPREPGQQSLAVEFTVNNDGTLEVRGEDLQSGKEVTTELESALESDNTSKKTLPPNA